MLTEKPEKVEKIGGKYNAVFLYFKDRVNIKYTDEKGEHEGDFRVEMKESLDWIKNNTSKDAIFLCWWDYGHMIKGYAERDAVIKDPSKEILKTVVHPEDIKEFESNEKIVDIATAFSTTDPNETLQIMQKYGASYILVDKSDLGKSYWVLWAAKYSPPSPGSSEP